MTDRIFLDLGDLPLGANIQIRNGITHVCPDLRVFELESRRTREIEAENVALVASVLSAICAVIALFLQGAQFKRETKKPTAEHVSLIVKQIEMELSVRLPEDLRSALTDSLTSDSPITVEVKLQEFHYTIQVEESAEYNLIHGRNHLASTRKE